MSAEFTVSIGIFAILSRCKQAKECDVLINRQIAGESNCKYNKGVTGLSDRKYAGHWNFEFIAKAGVIFGQ